MNNHHYDAATRCVANKGAAMQATETTKEAMVSKLVAAWEDKNAKRAAQGAGLSLMALSLAACGGSDAPVVVEPTPITPATPSLTAGQDILTVSDFTTVADTITADGTTLNSNDAIIEGHTGDGDTMNVAITASFSATPTVSGVENVNFNVASTGTNATTVGHTLVSIAIDNIAADTIKVNSTTSSETTYSLLGAPTTTVTGTDTIAVTGAGDVTVVAGTGVATLTVTMAADAVTVVDAGDATTVAINSANADTAVDQVARLTVNGDVALTTDDGDGTLTDLNITATAASVVTLSDAGTHIDTITATGSAVTLVGANGIDDFDGLTVTGVSVVRGADISADLSQVAATIEISGGSAVTSDLQVASGATIKLLTADDDIKVSLDDDLTTATTDGVVNVNLAVATASTGSEIVIDNSDADKIATLNVSSDEAQTLVLTATSGANTFNISGAGDFELDANTSVVAGSTLSAAALTGSLTATAEAQLLTITGGSGNDTITALTAAAFDLDGGAGSYDTIVSVADMTAGTFTNFEILANGTTNSAYLASQLSGSTLVVAGGGSLIIDGSVDGDTVDLTTINLSGLQFATGATTTVTVDVSHAADGTNHLTTQAFNITGSAAADTITGSANADTINGGAGDDIIDGGAGADVITGGTGADEFVLDLSTASSADTITEFVVADDVMSFGVTVATYEAIDQTSDTTISGASTLAGAVTAAFALANSTNNAGIEAISFTYADATYVAVEATATGDATNALVAEIGTLTGTLTLTDFIA